MVYNGANNEFVRTNTLVRGEVVLIDATPFRLWWESYYGVTLKRTKKVGTTTTKGQPAKAKKVFYLLFVLVFILPSLHASFSSCLTFFRLPPLRRLASPLPLPLPLSLPPPLPLPQPLPPLQVSTSLSLPSSFTLFYCGNAYVPYSQD